VQPRLDLASVPYGLGQQDQPERLREGLSGGHNNCQTLVHLCQACLLLALQGQGPALPDGPKPTKSGNPCVVDRSRRASACAWTAGAA